jgi:hypothetical protein
VSKLFDFSSIQIPSSSESNSAKKSADANDPAYIRDMYLSNPEQLAILRHNNPSLAAALDKGLGEFSKVLEEQRKAKLEQELLRIRMLLADPFDAEAQKLIQEEIKRQNIDSNMEAAMEYHPESFGSVTMLHINCKVNGYPVKAFIDSGAQSTIMSSACAERCHITRLIDTRWSGIAKGWFVYYKKYYRKLIKLKLISTFTGVGTQKIVGRIHLCQLQIEKDFLASSFTILESQDMDMLLGLDMLKRHQCCIDLKNNVLIIGTTGTTTRFLSENEIPNFGKNMF